MLSFLAPEHQQHLSKLAQKRQQHAFICTVAAHGCGLEESTHQLVITPVVPALPLSSAVREGAEMPAESEESAGSCQAARDGAPTPFVAAASTTPTAPITKENKKRALILRGCLNKFQQQKGKRNFSVFNSVFHSDRVLCDDTECVNTIVTLEIAHFGLIVASAGDRHPDEYT